MFHSPKHTHFTHNVYFNNKGVQKIEQEKKQEPKRKKVIKEKEKKKEKKKNKNKNKKCSIDTAVPIWQEAIFSKEKKKEQREEEGKEQGKGKEENIFKPSVLPASTRRKMDKMINLMQDQLERKKRKMNQPGGGGGSFMVHKRKRESTLQCSASLGEKDSDDLANLAEKKKARKAE